MKSIAIFAAVLTLGATFSQAEQPIPVPVPQPTAAPTPYLNEPPSFPTPKPTPVPTPKPIILSVEFPASNTYVAYKHNPDIIQGSPGTLMFDKDTAVFMQFSGFSQISSQAVTDVEIDLSFDGRLTAPLNEVVAAYLPKFRWSSKTYRELEPKLTDRLESLGKSFVTSSDYNQYYDVTNVVIKGPAVRALLDLWIAAENGSDVKKKNRGIVFWGGQNPLNIIYPAFASAKSVKLVVHYVYSYGY